MINPHYGNMGTDVGYFYFGLEIVTAVILFFIVPETARLSLEQLTSILPRGESMENFFGQKQANCQSRLTDVARGKSNCW